MTILVSVVVPTRRRPQLLERCLQALLTQNFPPDAYEVIVVDDGPDDSATRSLVQEWQQRLRDSYGFFLTPRREAARTEVPVTGRFLQRESQAVFQLRGDEDVHPRLVYLPAEHTSGPAAARNLGWRAAEGQVIAFTDDDCIPDQNWLGNGLQAFVGGVAGVSGRVIVPLPPDPTDNDRNTTGLERSDFVTANCFYRRSVLEEVGGFDERFRMAWREDSDLYFTIREKNYPLAWATGAVVLHPIRQERWGASARQQRKSFYNALLYKKHPILYWHYIQPHPPWRYYAMASFAAAGGAAFTMGMIHAAAGLLALWAALTTRFTIQRLQGTSHQPRHIAEMALTSIIIPFLSIFWRLRGAIHWRTIFL